MPFCPKCGAEFQDWVKECLDCKVALVEKLEPKPKPAKPVKPAPSPSTTLVTIASYTYPTEAYLAAAKLESEGIWSFVADEHIVNANWLYSGAIGGVKLRVREADAKEAKQILDAIKQNPQFTTDTIEICPNCHSRDIKYQTFNIPLVFVVWLITRLFIQDFTLPFYRRRWKCNNCGYQWKDNNWSPPQNKAH